MRKLFCALALALVLSLGACAQGIRAVSRGIQTNAEFNVLFLEDVQQAKLLAKAANDPLAVKCWSYLERFAVANAPEAEAPAGKVTGVLSLYQRGRNLRREVVEFKISDQFRLECGPMLTDTIGALGRIGIRIAL